MSPLSSPISRLPPEILEHIFWILDDVDHKSLKNCGLTSRAWVPHIRAVLFRGIFPGIGHQTFSLLSELLDTDPSVGSYVRDIIAETSSDERFTALATLAPQFGAVQSLILGFQGYIRNPLPTLASLGAIRNLTVNASWSEADGNTEECAALSNLIALFPTIESFGLCGDVYPFRFRRDGPTALDEAAPTDALALLPLRRLKVEGSAASRIMARYIATAAPTTVESLDITYVSGSYVDLPAITLIILAIAPTLRVFKMNLGAFPRNSEAKTLLKACALLERVEFKSELATVAFAPELFAHMSAPTLRSFKMTVLCYAFVPELHHWEPMVNLACALQDRRCFPGLRDVLISVQGANDEWIDGWDTMQTMIDDAFGVLRERGIAIVIYEDPMREETERYM